MKVGFDGGILLHFQGAKVSSNGGLPVYHALDLAFGLLNSVDRIFFDNRIFSFEH